MAKTNNKSNATQIIEVAMSLQSNHTKVELVTIARSMGWTGDHARAPVLQLALYVATKLAETSSDDAPTSAHSGGDSDPEQPQEQPEQPEQPEQEQPEQEQEQQPEQPEQQQPEQQPEEQPEQQQPEQQPEEQQPEEDEPEDDMEFTRLLKASGITQPHYLLEKVWRLSTKARQNVLLVGPAGCGKTMLAAQLAQLIDAPFGSISCTMGMSESQLSGWLLPVGAQGAFSYVPAPFITSMESRSVFLLDEIDAADPNVLMLLNSVMSNGFISVPHKLTSPVVTRHKDAIIIAGANTMGTGADDLYSARAALDGSTMDRFYPVVVEYDRNYEASLFNLNGKKSRVRGPKWESATAPDQLVMDDLRAWFDGFRNTVQKQRMNKIVSTRFIQKLVAAALAGIPMNEIKNDLFMGWSADEKAKVGV